MDVHRPLDKKSQSYWMVDAVGGKQKKRIVNQLSIIHNSMRFVHDQLYLNLKLRSTDNY